MLQKYLALLRRTFSKDKDSSGSIFTPMLAAASTLNPTISIAGNHVPRLPYPSTVRSRELIIDDPHF
jgi:hypothetical protein